MKIKKSVKADTPLEQEKAGMRMDIHHLLVVDCAQQNKQFVADEFSSRLDDGNCEVGTQEKLDSLFGKTAGKTVSYEELS